MEMHSSSLNPKALNPEVILYKLAYQAVGSLSFLEPCLKYKINNKKNNRNTDTEW